VFEGGCEGRIHATGKGVHLKKPSKVWASNEDDKQQNMGITLTIQIKGSGDLVGGGKSCISMASVLGHQSTGCLRGMDVKDHSAVTLV
jgi:hypothetical protein